MHQVLCVGDNFKYDQVVYKLTRARELIKGSSEYAAENGRKYVLMRRDGPPLACDVCV